MSGYLFASVHLGYSPTVARVWQESHESRSWQFLETSPKPASQGQSAGRKPPHAVKFLGQVGFENNWVELNGCGNPFKEEQSGGQKSQTSWLYWLFKGGGFPGAGRWKRAGMGLGQNLPTFHHRHHRRAWAGTKGQEADHEHWFYAEPLLSQLNNGKNLKLWTLPPINKKPFKMV